MNDIERLSAFKNMFGDIIFVGETEQRRKVYEKPWLYMFCDDGIHWEQVPMDIGKINYQTCLYRLIPEGISIGVSQEVKDNPENYLYSNDNGFSWYSVDKYNNCSWIYHGNHKNLWFKKK